MWVRGKTALHPHLLPMQPRLFKARYASAKTLGLVSGLEFVGTVMRTLQYRWRPQGAPLHSEVRAMLLCWIELWLDLK